MSSGKRSRDAADQQVLVDGGGREGSGKRKTASRAVKGGGRGSQEQSVGKTGGLLESFSHSEEEED